MSKLVENYLLQ